MRVGNFPFFVFGAAFWGKNDVFRRLYGQKNLWLQDCQSLGQEFFGRGGGIEDVRGGFTIERFAGGEHFGYLFRNGFPGKCGALRGVGVGLQAGCKDLGRGGKIEHDAVFAHEAAVFLRKHHVGFFYRIYMSRTIGAEGLGLYNMIHPLFSIAFAVCAGSIQTALSQYIAASQEKGPAVFKCGLFLSLSLSVTF